MPNIVFPCQDIRYDQIASSPQFSALANLGLAPQTSLQANMPYCSAQDASSRAIVQILGCLGPQERANLMHAVDTFGDQTVAVAELVDRQIRPYSALFAAGAGLTGATATSLDSRLTGFQKALWEYQQALIDLNNHNRVGRGGAARRAELQRLVRTRYDILQTKFKVELNRFIPPDHVGKNRGNALVSADRGITLAERKPGRALFITDTAQAHKTSRLAKSVRFVGRAAVVVDAGIRIDHVRNTYKSGGNWQREASIQTAGFGAGGAAGMTAGYWATKGVAAGVLALGLTITPVGWFVIIGVGATVGFAAAYGMDESVKRGTAKIWDRG